MSVVSGLHEFVFSAHISERERLLAFWAGLGFQPDAEGTLNVNDAEALYGHGAALTSIRLRHSTWSSGTGVLPERYSCNCEISDIPTLYCREPE